MKGYAKIISPGEILNPNPELLCPTKRVHRTNQLEGLVTNSKNTVL